jgi:hypothetical protein
MKFIHTIKQLKFILQPLLAVAVMAAPVVFDIDMTGNAYAGDHSSHDSGGHTPGGHSSGGHSSGGHSSGHVPGAGKGRGKGNPAADQHGGGRASDPDAERGVGYHGGSTLESKVLRGGAASRGKGGPGGRGGDSHSDTDHTDHEDTDSHDDSHESGSKGKKPAFAGKPEGVGSGEDHDHDH